MKKNSIEKSLIVPDKENIFTKFFKWVKGIFIKEEKIENIEVDELSKNEIENITIPKNVKMPVRIEDVDENSLEYLYNLSDEELDNLDELYDSQMEEQKNEALRLEDILQTYKQSIKKLQGEVDAEF